MTTKSKTNKQRAKASNEIFLDQVSTAEAKSIEELQNKKIKEQTNIATEIVQTDRLTKRSSGETCQEYWNKSRIIHSTVLSKYDTEQISKPGMVSCTCCNRKVPGKRVKWHGNEMEDIPVWTPCESCGVYLSHYEEDNSDKLLGMCIECHKQIGEVQK